MQVLWDKGLAKEVAKLSPADEYKLESLIYLNDFFYFKEMQKITSKHW